MSSIVIYTDGACSGNPGPGGWGVHILPNAIVGAQDLCDGEIMTTNNRMELMAAIQGLEAVPAGSPVVIWTDSQYVKDGITKWIPGWMRNGWRTADKKPVKNQDLWQRLHALTQTRVVTWEWVRGHNGNAGNERADQLSRDGQAKALARSRGEQVPEPVTSSAVGAAPAVARPKQRRLPSFITFTGLDALTNLARAAEISRRWPVEWGVLFSPSRQGKHNRYPDVATINNILTRLKGRQLAAHICGDYSTTIASGTWPDLPLQAHSLFSRMQINHADPLAHEAGILAALRQAGPDPLTAQVILQSRSEAFPAHGRFDFLFDCSAGTGRAPGFWPKHPGGDRLVGYAGGIGPSNVLEVIDAVGADGPYWIDMESRIRDADDWLDLDKVEAVCRAVYGEGKTMQAPTEADRNNAVARRLTEMALRNRGHVTAVEARLVIDSIAELLRVGAIAPAAGV